MLYKIPYYIFLLKECIKWCNWFQTFYIRKCASLYAITCSLCQFDEKKSHENFQNLEILKQKVAREMIPLLNNLFCYFFISIRFNISNFRCMSHVQETIMWKNMFSWFLKPIFTFFFVFMLTNKNIHAQLCMHVKNHHHDMNYLIFDYWIFLIRICFM